MKAKNKAKAVTIQLKKVTKHLVRNKTEEVNAQLKSLETVVRQSEPPKKPAAPAVKRTPASVEAAVMNYETKEKKTDEALEALAGFSVDS